MARIRSYEQQIEPTGRIDSRRATASDFGAGVGQALGEGFAGVADVLVQKKIQDENVYIDREVAQFRALQVKKLTEAKANAGPNAQDFTPGFMTSYDKDFDEVVNRAPEGRVREELTTRLGYEARGMFEADAITYEAAQRVAYRKESVADITNQNGSVLQLYPDAYEALRDETLDAAKRIGIPGAESEAVQNEIKASLAKYKVQGLVMAGRFGEAEADLKSGTLSKDISPEEVPGLLRSVYVAKNAAEEEAKKAREEAAKVEQQTMLELVTRGRKQPDGSFQPLSAQEKTAAVMESDLDAFGTGSKQQLLNIIESGEGKTNAAVFNEMAERIVVRGQKVPDDELIGLVGNGLTWSDYEQLRDERDDPQMGQAAKTWLDGVKGSVTGSNGLMGPDPEGDYQYMQLIFEARQRYRQAKEDKLDPEKLFTPGTKEYIGDELAAKYTRSPQEIMRSQVNALKRGSKEGSTVKIEPRRTGESIEDYQKRINGGE